MTTPQDIVFEARKLVGTPYQHQGRLAGVGVDCIGVPILVARELGLGDFNDLEYGREPDGSLLPKIKGVCQPIEIQSGVLLIFKISSVAQHCGILSEIDKNVYGLIHAWDIADKVVEQRLGDWRKKIVGIYAFPGVDYTRG